MNMNIMSTKRMKIVSFLIVVFCLIGILFTITQEPAVAAAASDDINRYRFNMSYIYFGSTSSYINAVDKTGESIDEISPSYFDLNANGTLKLTNNIDSDFIAEMHSRNINVVPFISNHWYEEIGRAALKNREELVEQIVEAVKEYNLDGVNVDLENLKERDRNDYTDFVKKLRENLPSDKVVAVAVAANPWASDKDWQGSYDYKALGEHSDYLMIMAYDQHYEGGKPGPVAGYGFVEDSIRYALKHVPKGKIVLGIPFYGRMWKQGDAEGGQGISLTTVEKLIAKYNGKVHFDDYHKSPKAVITINPWDSKPVVMGRVLGAGTYTIWYENETSIKYKLELVNKYDIKGTGSWSLGQEPSNTWDYYDLWLNGYYYSDAQGHWAKKYIMEAANKGWMIGNGKSSFSPNSSLTRAEAATALVRSLDLKEFEEKYNKSEKDGTDSSFTFNDISGHWAEEYIKIAAKYELVLGRGDNTFGPDDNITRAELAVMMDRIFAQRKTLPSRGDSGMSDNEYQLSYSDVSPEINIWSYESIKRMSYLGVFIGTPDGKFLPDNSTTRAELATLLCRIIK